MLNSHVQNFTLDHHVYIRKQGYPEEDEKAEELQSEPKQSNMTVSKFNEGPEVTEDLWEPWLKRAASNN